MYTQQKPVLLTGMQMRGISPRKNENKKAKGFEE